MMGEAPKLDHEELAVRKYMLWRRGLLKSGARRKPDPRVSHKTRGQDRLHAGTA
jgi:hypothetical protein